ncbi:MAG: response regulator [Methanoregula sp.]|jgi:DNA-binding response OmpR family regulator
MAVKKILIVDDQEDILDLFSMVLGSHGYSVTTAMTARDALVNVRTGYHNLALLDIGLPDMQGTDLLEKMRVSNPDMIIIMVTGNPELETAINAINHGADGYIVKPVSNNDLVAIIDKKLKSQEESRQLTDEKVSEWLENRLSRLDLENPGTST